MNLISIGLGDQGLVCVSELFSALGLQEHSQWNGIAIVVACPTETNEVELSS
jgi:hypothetical protein